MNCTERGELAVESRCTQWSAFCWTSSETQGQHWDRKIWKVTVVTIVISCSFWEGVDSKKLTVTVPQLRSDRWPGCRGGVLQDQGVLLGWEGRGGCMTGSFSIFFFPMSRCQMDFCKKQIPISRDLMEVWCCHILLWFCLFAEWAASCYPLLQICRPRRKIQQKSQQRSPQLQRVAARWRYFWPMWGGPRVKWQFRGIWGLP